MGWIKKVGNIFSSDDDLQRATYKSYNILKGIGLALVLFVVYTFHFSAIILTIVFLTTLNIIISICKARRIEVIFNPYRFPEVPIVLSLSTISFITNYYIPGIAGLGNKYSAFLSDLRDFLLQHGIRGPNFHFTQFAEDFYDFVISSGYTLEVVMLIFQLLAIFLYFKTILGFAYLVLNDERLIKAYGRYKNIKKSDSESKKTEALNNHEWVLGSWGKYMAYSGIMLVFSMGLPYWIIIALIHLANI